VKFENGTVRVGKVHYWEEAYSGELVNELMVVAGGRT
jgi:hypothetical protein